jgi:hypothetical protein
VHHKGYVNGVERCRYGAGALTRPPRRLSHRRRRPQALERGAAEADRGAGVDLHSHTAPGDEHTTVTDATFYTEEADGERSLTG